MGVFLTTKQLFMDIDVATLAIAISVLSLAFSIYSFSQKVNKETSTGYEATPLRLQAYERLVLLTERVGLPQLISRLNQSGISAVEMKTILTENIRQEFEYNSSQQLYVSPLSWEAVKNLKEQNIMFINQVAASLPLDASGADLNKKILELVMSQPDGLLHELVGQTLNKEAKKLMN
jgi:hypothetical protein